MDAQIDIGARITGATTDIATKVTNAIREAARLTGAGFDYLLKTAIRESNLNPEVKAPTSSATGLFQFIDQTWLETLKTEGPALGYGRFADAIVQTASGRYIVPDAAMHREIMELRKDPTANAVMAGAFTNRNADVLSARLQRDPTEGELYMAHFLGPAGAARFIASAESTPDGRAADLFPKAARANRSIFYDRAGNARSLSQVYATLAAKHGSNQTVARAAPVPAAPPLLQVREVAAPATVAYAEETRPVFHGLFRSETRGAVAPVVTRLWGPGGAARTQLANAVTPASATSRIAAPGRIGAPLDLFSFLRPGIRSS
ncbi:MAG: lytic transglycosylase domain-containing protein [Xanthobacteraceae bacterium]|nr:lytic transglycosylase domain-containing protein [Xanthobacteraceae bacterium]